MTTFEDMFRKPTPDVAEAVAAEREAGLAELDLYTRGLLGVSGEQPDSPAETEQGEV